MKSIPTIFLRHNFATVVSLPDSEVIEYLVAGDTTHWSYNRERPNTFHVIPLKPLRTPKGKKGPVWDGAGNIHAITKSGNEYPFDLQEVEGKFDASIKVASNEKKPEPTEICDTGLKVQLTEAKVIADERQAQVDRLSLELQGKVDPVEFVSSLQDDYRIPSKLKKEPFSVSRIFTRKGYTYIRSKAKHQAAFFEKEGKQKRHIDPEYHNGLYVIQGEVEEGCLKLGKSEGCFKKKG